MRRSLRTQKIVECAFFQVSDLDGFKPDKHSGGLAAAFMGTAQEILLFSISFVLLLFNLLEKQEVNQPRYVEKQQR